MRRMVVLESLSDEEFIGYLKRRTASVVNERK